MKTMPILWMTLSAALLLVIPFAARSQNQVPAAINYQGHLTDTLGNPAASGYYEIEFRVWDDAVQAGAGDLVWGRAFALHVVTNGLFNILLTDDGGLITDPTTPTNTLLTAFSGEDRYLGLTITTSNGVSIASPTEISPRQQLACAPYAIEAQVANTVGPLGVTSTALANGSVVADKLGTGAVTADKIASGAVTEAKIGANAVTSDAIAHGAVVDGKIAAAAVTTAAITNGAVTASKLNIDGDVHWNSHTLYLNSGDSHGLAFNGSSFAGNSQSGPILWGYNGGLLGTVNGGDKVALEWANDKSVTAQGKLTVDGELVVKGELTARNNPVSMFGPLVNETYYGKKTHATTDGIAVFYGSEGHWRFRLWDSSDTLVLTFYTYGDTGGANDTMASFPVAKGEYWEWDIDPNSSGNGSASHQIMWRPIGTN